MASPVSLVSNEYLQPDLREHERQHFIGTANMLDPVSMDTGGHLNSHLPAADFYG
ncbi:hypothetical protein BWQ96_07533 [Gracilariopsis chorda]|uniref:Uncharacterized protein n=1 Tax=Gracilariopsis chorda TaxID=448386 RepID=A0A2V3IKY5_9FLOR|nr:hypothetical protein BWQ96_07533 [Gracilariopsis chorda]|eukprot:PXF42718.1 hypothetical protein BWQ96_07533 [Gracilariopsis chorda]